MNRSVQPVLRSLTRDMNRDKERYRPLQSVDHIRDVPQRSKIFEDTDSFSQPRCIITCCALGHEEP